MYIFLDFREPALLNLHSHMFLSAAQSLASATSRKDTTSYIFTKRVNHHRSGLVGRTSSGGNTQSAQKRVDIKIKATVRRREPSHPFHAFLVFTLLLTTLSVNLGCFRIKLNASSFPLTPAVDRACVT